MDDLMISLSVAQLEKIVKDALEKAMLPTEVKNVSATTQVSVLDTKKEDSLKKKKKIIGKKKLEIYVDGISFNENSTASKNITDALFYIFVQVGKIHLRDVCRTSPDKMTSDDLRNMGGAILMRDFDAFVSTSTKNFGENNARHEVNRIGDYYINTHNNAERKEVFLNSVKEKYPTINIQTKILKD